ncbi:MAG: hypothetical protein ABEN55_09365, partial [Bradymonadaceae bacterium]
MFDDDKSRHRWLLVALLLAVAAVYARAVTFGDLGSFDDANYLFNRPEVRSWWGATWWRRLTTPTAGYWIPVPTFIYAHLRSAFPDLYVHVVHGVNIAVHLVNVGLVCALVSRWSTRRSGLAVAAIWALHPVQVETVAWLTSLKNLTYGAGMLGALLVWDRYLEKDRWPASPVGAVAAVFGLFLLALGSRPEAVVLPALLMALSWFRRRRWRPDRPTLGLVAAQGVIGAIYLPMATAGQREVLTGGGGEEISIWHWTVRVFRAL